MARNVRTHAPASLTAPRRADYAEVWDVQREVVLLTAQLLNERDVLTTWQRRLQLRITYEKTHDGQSQVPQLRQATAQCHARLLNLEQRLIDARHLLRVLLARQDAR